MVLEMALGSKDAFCVYPLIAGLSQDSVGDSGDSGRAHTHTHTPHDPRVS